MYQNLIFILKELITPLHDIKYEEVLRLYRKLRKELKVMRN